jgi:hypothetical protein
MKPVQNCLVALLILFAFVVRSQTVLVPLGSSWRFHDAGIQPATNWQASNFDDAGWKNGLASLGYGNGSETTVTNFGSDPNQKFITTYFRKTINIPSVNTFAKYILSINRDDGAVVYINGVKRWRSNMPSGTITNNTLASSVAADDGTSLKSVSIPASYFVNGANVIALRCIRLQLRITT